MNKNKSNGKKKCQSPVESDLPGISTANISHYQTPKLIPTDPAIRSKMDRFRFEIAGFILNIMDHLLKL